jgi:hypothetical protein
MATAFQEVQGTGDTTSQNDDQGVLTDTPAKRKEIVAAAKRLKEIAAERERLTADRRAVMENLVADKVSRDAIDQAVKECDMDEEKLERHDFTHAMARSALGKPVQGQLFAGDTTH